MPFCSRICGSMLAQINGSVCHSERSDTCTCMQVQVRISSFRRKFRFLKVTIIQTFGTILIPLRSAIKIFCPHFFLSNGGMSAAGPADGRTAGTVQGGQYFNAKTQGRQDLMI